MQQASSPQLCSRQEHPSHNIMLSGHDFYVPPIPHVLNCATMEAIPHCAWSARPNCTRTVAHSMGLSALFNACVFSRQLQAPTSPKSQPKHSSCQICQVCSGHTARRSPQRTAASSSLRLWAPSSVLQSCATAGFRQPRFSVSPASPL